MRRIFELCATGNGLTNITKALNAEGAPAPRPQQGRPAASAPSSVRAVLMRPLYRGEIVWNRTRKRHTWGRSKRSNRDDTTWLRVPAPTLQIVSDELWHDAQRERLARERPFATGGRCYRPSKYLLSGLARCAECSGGFASHSRQHGGHRALFYACTTALEAGRAGVPQRAGRADGGHRRRSPSHAATFSGRLSSSRRSRWR